MEWLEIIELRSAPGSEGLLESQLESLAASGRGSGITIYRRVNLNTDFSIHIRHESPVTNDRGSALGLQLVRALSPCGLVNHTVWVPESPRPGGTETQQ